MMTELLPGKSFVVAWADRTPPGHFRPPVSKLAELQVRIAVLNGYTVLGMPFTEAIG